MICLQFTIENVVTAWLRFYRKDKLIEKVLVKI